MLEVQSLITKKWYKVLYIDDLNITYEDGNNKFTITTTKAKTRFKNPDNSWYSFNDL